MWVKNLPDFAYVRLKSLVHFLWIFLYSLLTISLYLRYFPFDHCNFLFDPPMIPSERSIWWYDTMTRNNDSYRICSYRRSDSTNSFWATNCFCNLLVCLGLTERNFLKFCPYILLELGSMKMNWNIEDIFSFVRDTTKCYLLEFGWLLNKFGWSIFVL